MRLIETVILNSHTKKFQFSPKMCKMAIFQQKIQIFFSRFYFLMGNNASKNFLKFFFSLSKWKFSEPCKFFRDFTQKHIFAIFLSKNAIFGGGKLLVRNPPGR